jgi:hypothetical protein
VTAAGRVTATEVAAMLLARRLPTWDPAQIATLVQHPRRCAPDYPTYVRITGLPPELAHGLWAPQTRKDAA